MIHYDKNAAVVIDTLTRYHYGSATIRKNKNCFAQLKEFMEIHGIAAFSLEMAQDWCERNGKKTTKRPFSLALLRLSDVYENGRVLSSHLTIHGELSKDFNDTMTSYIESLPEDEYVESSFERIREACSMFFRFCQINGAYSLKDIDYPVLEGYHKFIVEAEEYEAYEGCNERMMAYWAEMGECRIGYSLFFHYARFEKNTGIDDLSPDSRRIVENRRSNSSCLPLDKFFHSIPGFIEKMASFGYCRNILHAYSYYLNVLCLFLDHADLGYDRIIADTWVKDVGPRLFGKCKVDSALRTFGLFDDYITNTDITPTKKYKSRVSILASLPEWCRDILEAYRKTRLKEGLKPHTITKQINICAKFCSFLVSENLASFAGLTPDLIKRFNLWDEHKTSAGKNSANQTISQFIIHLELKGTVPQGLNLALSCGTSKSEHIVKVLNNEDQERISRYCGQAKSPIELRDAAMLKLGLNTAFRGCDIVSLKISDIDWKSRCISVIQSKTGVSHIHPVDTGTLNAVFRYLRDGRDKRAATDYLFVSVKAPFGPVFSGVCEDAMLRAGLSVRDFHRLRRTYATDALKGGATFTEAAELLGHSGTGTIHRYALLDEERMRLCPLSLEETGLAIEGRYADGK